MTFGSLLNELSLFLDINEESVTVLKNSLNKRNYLIHRFFYEKAYDFVSSQGMDEMIDELRQLIDLFTLSTTMLEALTSKLIKIVNIDSNILKKVIRDIIEENVNKDVDVDEIMKDTRYSSEWS